MALFNRIFGKKEEEVNPYREFWLWFQKHEKDFFKTVKSKKNIEKSFIEKIASKLNEFNDAIYFLAGMADDETAEIIFTADGNLKNIVFVEELVDAAIKIENWKFASSKPAINDIEINMEGYTFGSKNMSFFPNVDPNHPDEIDITIVHEDLNDENAEIITNGTFIFLDTFLGELNFITTIDNLNVIGKDAVDTELNSMDKLNDYLVWRQKEFLEKYEGVRYDTENDTYTGFEAELESGAPLFAAINTDLLNWDRKASHPWMLKIEMTYDGTGREGMPDNETYDLMNAIEDEIMEELKDYEGYLNIGRETADSIRSVYFACKEFRLPSRVTRRIQSKYANHLDIDYDIFKDKYWKSLERFRL
jgi:hypothetical protein